MRLNELRKNPEQNKKVNVVDAIKPYMDGNHYFSFRDDKKLGINPKSDFDTPNGVYAWPRSQVNTMGGELSVPYAGDAPYIFVMKPKVKIVKTSEITHAWVVKALDRLEVMYDLPPRDKNKGYSGGAYTDDPYLRFHMYTKDMAMEGSSFKDKSLWINKWRSMFVAVGIKAIEDDTEAFIGPDEPNMVVFFTKDSYEVVDMLLNKSYEKIDPREKRHGNTGYSYDELDKRKQSKEIDQRKKGTDTQYKADRF